MKWDKIVQTLGGIGGFIWGAFGGRDTMLTVLMAMMIIDYVTGLIVGWCGKSPKTDTGHISSHVGWIGLAKKAGELLAVIVGVLLDMLATEKLGYTGAVFRTGIIMYILLTEAISVLENLGLLDVPLPQFVKKALEQLKDKVEKDNENKVEN